MTNQQLIFNILATLGINYIEIKQSTGITITGYVAGRVVQIFQPNAKIEELATRDVTYILVAYLKEAVKELEGVYSDKL